LGDDTPVAAQACIPQTAFSFPPGRLLEQHIKVNGKRLVDLSKESTCQAEQADETGKTEA
jgi:hypothetical protein